MNSRELSLIAFVTRRYGDLQGLRPASLGFALLAAVYAFDFLPDTFPMLYVVVFGSLMSGGISASLDRYYRRVFGAVADRASTVVAVRRFPREGILPGAVNTGLMMDFIKVGTGFGGPSIGALAMLSFGLWIVVRDGVHRLFYLIAVFGGVAAAMVTAAAPRPNGRVLGDPVVDGYYIVAITVIGLTLVAVGLMDHRLLANAMHRPTASEPTWKERTPVYLSGLRIGASTSVLAVVLGYLLLRGWPSEPLPFILALFVASLPFILISGWDDLTWGFSAYSELTRAREARLLALLKGAKPSLAQDTADGEPTSVPKPDFVGHLVLPLAMATGAVLDIAVRPNQLPSIMALALVLSQGRIALRDWPSRKHYAIGAAAAMVAAALHMWIGRITPVDWVIAFLLLTASANLVEGFFDRRLEAGQRQVLDGRYGHAV